MIAVKPDPAHPRGGYAELSLPDAELAGDTTQVAVFDNYSERYLGEAGWQPSKVLFGPYDVVRDGGEARLIIGPEIVNQIEEYANVKLLVGGVEQDVSWPDEVVPAPGAARIGGIMGAAAAVEKAPKSALTARIEEPEPKDAPGDPDPVQPVEPAPVEPENEESDLTATTKGGKGGMIFGLLAMVLVAAGLAYWLLNADGVPPATPVAKTEPVVAPAPLSNSDDPCSAAQLAALDGFAAQTNALRDCGSKATADAALGLVERAAATGNAEALLLFGTVYDAEASDPVIEDEIGLTFGDVPATAAEYYARAAVAGSAEAKEKLVSLCTRMADMTDTLVQGAVTDYCGN